MNILYCFLLFHILHSISSPDITLPFESTTLFKSFFMRPINTSLIYISNLHKEAFYFTENNTFFKSSSFTSKITPYIINIMPVLLTMGPIMHVIDKPFIFNYILFYSDNELYIEEVNDYDRHILNINGPIYSLYRFNVFYLVLRTKNTIITAIYVFYGYILLQINISDSFGETIVLDDLNNTTFLDLFSLGETDTKVHFYFYDNTHSSNN